MLPVIWPKKINYSHQKCQHSGKKQQTVGRPFRGDIPLIKHGRALWTLHNKNHKLWTAVAEHFWHHFEEACFVVFHVFFSLTCLQWEGLTADAGTKDVRCEFALIDLGKRQKETRSQWYERLKKAYGCWRMKGYLKSDESDWLNPQRKQINVFKSVHL